MSPSPKQSRRAVAAWLLACCALVFAMVVIGGITRLTHSGLSIVEWQPIMGAIPPLSEQQWAETFAKYQPDPEFRQRNHDMTVEGFKGIFWWEYIHRLLGRVIGVAFLVPFLYFLLRRRLEPEVAWKLGGIFVLGGAAGRAGLVHGPERAGGRAARELDPARGAPRPRIPHLRRDAVGGARASSTASAARSPTACEGAPARWWRWCS